MAVVSARLPDEFCARSEMRVTTACCGVVLADWAALARDPALVLRYRHLVVIDPPPFAHLERLVALGDGYLHRVGGDAEREFALRVHADEWPSRASLAALYRSLGSRLHGGEWLAAADARELLCGEGRTHPLAPEAAARAARVLVELELCEWEGSSGSRRLRVVSSKGTELERSEAYRAYGARHEEGRRFLSERRQS